MSDTTSAQFTHYAFTGDSRARCGLRFRRGRVACVSTVPGHVTCRACLEALIPESEKGEPIVVTLTVDRENLPVLEALAAAAGKSVEDNLAKVASELLAAKVKEWRALLYAPREAS